MVFRNRIPPPGRLFSRRIIQVDAFQVFFAELIVAEEICPAELPKAAGSYVAGTALGAYQSILNMMPYHLTGAPYFMATWIVSLIFLVNLFGSFAASTAGSLASRFGRCAVVPVAGIILALILRHIKPLSASGY